MPRSKAKRDEKEYYDSLLCWLHTQGYYVGQYMYRSRSQKPYWYKNLGSKVRGDVVGVKNVGNRYVDEIEIAVVEVKDKPITFRHVEQAYGYSLFAHKCYLATPYEISEEQKSIAHEFGIGLLQIGKERKLKGKLAGLEGPFYNVKEALSPQLSTPKSKVEMVKFLDTLSIVQCSICQCYVFDWARDGSRPRTIIKMIRGKQLSGRNDDAYAPFEDKPPREYRIHRYICLDCARQLLPILKRYTSKKSRPRS